MAGNPIAFEAKDFIDNTLRWNWGDGTTNNGPKNRSHTFSNPGSYTVTVKDRGGNSHSAITCTVNILPDNRSVSFQPSTPKAGQKVTFQAHNFSSVNLEWNFKDGTIQNGGQSKDHTFTSQGNFKVKVTDLGVGQDSFIEQTINVSPDNRTITMNPQNPALYDEVTFNRTLILVDK